MKKITVEMLREMDACKDQVEVFERIFPDGASVTMKSLKKARDARLDIAWLECLLSDPALEKYKKVVGLARAKYYKVVTPAQKEFLKVKDHALIDALKESAR